MAKTRVTRTNKVAPFCRRVPFESRPMDQKPRRRRSQVLFERTYGRHKDSRSHWLVRRDRNRFGRTPEPSSYKRNPRHNQGLLRWSMTHRLVGLLSHPRTTAALTMIFWCFWARHNPRSMPMSLLCPTKMTRPRATKMMNNCRVTF